MSNTVTITGDFSRLHAPNVIRQIDHLLSSIDNPIIEYLGADEHADMIRDYAQAERIPMLHVTDTPLREKNAKIYGIYFIAINPSSYNLRLLDDRNQYRAYNGKTAVIHSELETPIISSEKNIAPPPIKKGTGKRRNTRKIRR